MKDYFKIPITSEKEAKKYLDRLNEDELSYHPDNFAEEIITISHYTLGDEPTLYPRLFTDEEAVEINNRMNEVFVFLKDPFEYILNNHIK